MSNLENTPHSTVSLYNLLDQELQEYLSSAEAQELLVSRDLFDFENENQPQGFERYTPETDPFFSDMSPEEFDVETEDLLGLSVLVPVADYMELTSAT
jgi:hypothetical protein